MLVLREFWQIILDSAANKEILTNPAQIWKNSEKNYRIVPKKFWPIQPLMREFWPILLASKRNLTNSPATEGLLTNSTHFCTNSDQLHPLLLELWPITPTPEGILDNPVNSCTYISLHLLQYFLTNLSCSTSQKNCLLPGLFCWFPWDHGANALTESHFMLQTLFKLLLHKHCYDCAACSCIAEWSYSNSLSPLTVWNPCTNYSSCNLTKIWLNDNMLLNYPTPASRWE